MTGMRWVGVALAALSVASGVGEVDLCSYRTPTTEFLQGKVSFFYQHVDEPTTAGLTVSSGWLSFDARRQHDSATAGFTLTGGGRLRFRNVALVQTEVGASGAVRQYLATDRPFYAFGGLDAAFDTTYPQPRVEAQAGLGTGRFYNVTPLAKALQIDETLFRRRAIPIPLSDGVLREVAGAVGEGGSVEERVASVVPLIEQFLGEQGLAPKLDPSAVLAVEEVISQAIQERYCGWTAQAGIAYEIFDPRGGPRDLLFSLALDAAVPAGADTQLLLRSKIAGPYGLTDQYTLTLEATLETRVNDMINFSTRYTLFHDKPRGQLPAGTQSAVFQFEISWGWVGLTVQLEFSKVAEAPAWKQSLVVTSTAYLW